MNWIDLSAVFIFKEKLSTFPTVRVEEIEAHI